MTGAESLLWTLVGSGVEVCFGNPGTSEMHFVAALDKVAGMRAVLGLFEGAVTGMADGYGRMAEKPAATLLHLGPGLANGLANLHNARRASTPIVNIVGDHATYHAQYDAPLASDVVGFARTVSAWVHSSTSAKTAAADAARAVQAALQYPGQIATLILPADTQWLEADRPAPALPKPMPAIASAEAIDQAASALRSGRKTMILLRGAALNERGLRAAGRIAAASGARIACDTFAPRCQRGAGRVEVERIPYFAEQIVEFMKGTEQLILVGASPPVSFFAYPNKPSWCTPEGCKNSLSRLLSRGWRGCAGIASRRHQGARKSRRMSAQPGNRIFRTDSSIRSQPARSSRIICRAAPLFPTKARPQAAGFIGLQPISSRTIILRWRVGRSDKAFRSLPAPRSPVRTGKFFVSRATAAACTRCRRCGRRREKHLTSRP